MKRSILVLLAGLCAAATLTACLPGDGDKCGNRVCVYRSTDFKAGYQAYEPGRYVDHYSQFYFDSIHGGDGSNVNDQVSSIVNGTSSWVAFYSGAGYTKGDGAGETWTKICFAPRSSSTYIGDKYNNKVSSSRPASSKPTGCSKTFS